MEIRKTKRDSGYGNFLTTDLRERWGERIKQTHPRIRDPMRRLISFIDVVGPARSCACAARRRPGLRAPPASSHDWYADLIVPGTTESRCCGGGARSRLRALSTPKHQRRAQLGIVHQRALVARAAREDRPGWLAGRLCGARLLLEERSGASGCIVHGPWSSSAASSCQGRAYDRGARVGGLLRAGWPRLSPWNK